MKWVNQEMNSHYVCTNYAILHRQLPKRTQDPEINDYTIHQWNPNGGCML